eukprot:GFKZ01013678.1.p1 GENE.GFKZ01013678.1~~GFKZ01013678.1.p1  ORF type:complete len:141 (-),score=9.54 GFKZ01013678.1:1130-1552(-)
MDKVRQGSVRCYAGLKTGASSGSHVAFAKERCDFFADECKQTGEDGRVAWFYLLVFIITALMDDGQMHDEGGCSGSRQRGVHLAGCRLAWCGMFCVGTRFLWRTKQCCGGVHFRQMRRRRRQCSAVVWVMMAAVRGQWAG